MNICRVKWRQLIHKLPLLAELWISFRLRLFMGAIDQHESHFIRTLGDFPVGKDQEQYELY
jgi:hypothetical protein